jgi:hypothetical protein
MRTSVVATFLAFLAPGCAVEQVVHGTVSYTATPQMAEHSGALPLTAVVCAKTSTPARAGVRLGDCVLRGAWIASRSGGTAPLLAAGPTCELPTRSGSIKLQIDSGSLTIEGNDYGGTADVAVGGRTDDGRYFTYRFTGPFAGPAEGDACDAVYAD